ncbi:DUF3772 domain-containing protein [Maritalea mobilis]|uniref:DUF3772 domain-containing protein n=1 Tax=Maritalea mobilis TaxID=483324 RepID=UPI001C9878E7|nr:DUF3772 domain-containing protein [Maritalea mobilis]MBY6200163.1 DUF3772 domain-containing protein [Maritalea mobilis]
MNAVMRTLRLALVMLALSLVALGSAAPVIAQEATPATATASGIDYEAWESEATRIENLLEAGTASTAFFENLRETLVNWRARFLDAESANSTRINTLQAQIDALGAPPAEGETEPDAIAQRRATLNTQLQEAQVPRVEASQAYTRADGLITEIDNLLSARQQEQLLELAPSPANPVNWTPALTGLTALAGSLQSDFMGRLTNPAQREQFLQSAPVLVVMLLVALVALLRGRLWTHRLTDRLEARTRERGRPTLVFFVSLLQMLIPLVGLILVLGAFVASGLVGPSAQSLLEALAALMTASYFALWLGGRLFPEGDLPMGVLELDSTQRARARRIFFIIGFFVGLAVVMQTIAAMDEVPPAAQGVLQLPVYVGLALFFWRASRLLQSGRTETGEDESPGFMRRILSLVQRLLLLVGVAGPALAVVGYVNMAESLMVPTALSLAIFGVLVALQPVVRDLYAIIFRTTHDSASEALLPIVVNFLLAFGALPLFALTWGVRPEQLAEVYARFWEGFTIGEARITPGNIFAVVLFFAVGYVATRLLQGALRSTVLPRTKLDTGARNAVTSGVGYVGIGLAAMIAITAGGIDLTALGFVLGALSVGIGFGLQNVVNNFVSGIILLIERPISEGDWIEVGSYMGIVKRISVRSTRIETFDKTDVIVPNADFISGTVTNWTRGNTIGRAVITVGVAYGTDTRKVQNILMEIVRENPVVAAFPEPGVDFLGFGADSLDFRIRAILRDVNQLVSVKTEIHHRIAERFAEEGIEIPFAQRDIWLRNPEALRPTPKTVGQDAEEIDVETEQPQIEEAMTQDDAAPDGPEDT